MQSNVFYHHPHLTWNRELMSDVTMNDLWRQVINYVWNGIVQMDKSTWDRTRRSWHGWCPADETQYFSTDEGT